MKLAKVQPGKLERAKKPPRRESHLWISQSIATLILAKVAKVKPAKVEPGKLERAKKPPRRANTLLHPLLDLWRAVKLAMSKALASPVLAKLEPEKLELSKRPPRRGNIELSKRLPRKANVLELAEVELAKPESPPETFPSLN